MKFADILGYSFRKKIALTMERQAIRHDVAEQDPGDDSNRTLQHPWTGGGAFDELVEACPFPFVTWLLVGEENRVKVRGAMDISRLGPTRSIGIPHGIRGDVWWYGLNIDVWLKTPMLTFNRIFPHEINRFAPVLCDVEELAKHLRFASMFDLRREFSDAYLAGLGQQQSQGAGALAAAEGLACEK